MDTKGNPSDDADEQSAPSQVRTREELGAALTAARVAAGFSVRDVVRLVPSLSLGTASGWFSGQHVPTRASEATLVEMLGLLGAGESVLEWKAAVERVRSRPGPRRTTRRAAPPPASRTDADGPAPNSARGDDTPGVDPQAHPAVPQPDDTGSPYVGLRPYLNAEAPLFHGRSATVEQILSRFADPRDRPLVVLGASGSGKSSVLAAGVAPRWADAGSTVAIVRPAELTPELLAAPGHLVVDQLEELWANDIAATHRTGVLESLALRAARGLPTVMALRADFFQPALAEPVLREALHDPVVIGPPSREELTEIIVEPARALGYTVDPSLVNLLLDAVAPDDAAAGPGERSLLPLLSHVLLVCWERSRRRRITVADYYASGGIEGALRASADAVYQQLDPPQRAACRTLFLRLVDVRSARIVRRHAPLAELSEDLLVVATPFAQAGLLTMDGDSVTPTHEILFSSWPRLVDWIDADREGLRVLTRVRTAAADWGARGRSESALPTASATADYVRWRDHDDDDGANSHLAPSELRFLAAAEAHHEALARKDRGRIRALTTLAASFAVVTVLALVSAGFALRATSDARETRDVALSRSGSVSSTTAFTRDPALGRALALAAYRIRPTTDARSALLNTSRADVPLRFAASAGTGRVVALPNADEFASVSSDGVLRLFGSEQSGPVASLALGSGDRPELYGVDVSPDGAVLAISGQGGVHLVDVRDPAAPALLTTLSADDGPFHSVGFSPDGSTLAAGTGDGRVLRWPLASRGNLPTVTDQRARVSIPPTRAAKRPNPSNRSCGSPTPGRCCSPTAPPGSSPWSTPTPTAPAAAAPPSTPDPWRFPCPWPSAATAPDSPRAPPAGPSTDGRSPGRTSRAPGRCPNSRAGTPTSATSPTTTRAGSPPPVPTNASASTAATGRCSPNSPPRRSPPASTSWTTPTSSPTPSTDWCASGH